MFFEVEFHFQACEHEPIFSCTPKHPLSERRIHGVALVALYFRWKGRSRGTVKMVKGCFKAFANLKTMFKSVVLPQKVAMHI